MKLNYLFLMTIIGFQMHGITAEKLTKILHEAKSPFSYNMGIKIFSSKHKQAPIMICCHGYGANNQIGDAVHSAGAVQDHIVSFNFPDYDLHRRAYDPKKSAFGSINELLPLFYLLKKSVIDAQQEKINLYGFSAGGAVVINMLAVLNHNNYDAQLKEIGISAEDKEKIRAALEKGIIILDCPMKSVEELMDARGKSEEFEILAKRYVTNNMRPIDAVQELKGLNLTILLYFENPDEILGNRDDQLFIERLKKANSGKTEVITGSYGGHNSYHRSLWDKYRKI
jgi:hypothetical protein